MTTASVGYALIAIAVVVFVGPQIARPDWFGPKAIGFGTRPVTTAGAVAMAAAIILFVVGLFIVRGAR